METKQKNIPTVFIIFGATGDLMTQKIVPALFHLYIHKNLPKLFHIIGFSRRDWNQDEFRKHVKEILLSHKDKKKKEDIENFLNLIAYQHGNFDSPEAYKTLAGSLGIVDTGWNACSNKLFYLAVPPKFYKTILENLAESGLTIPCGGDEGWTRILVEKPFGNDLKTAQDLDILLATLFKEEQLYRIDHYLGKDLLQNILEFRFANALFEGQWNREHIKKIEVRILEKLGVEERGAFYDGVGAFRDVGQNHLLQMLSLVTMDRPVTYDAVDVRQKRAEIFSYLKTPSVEDVKTKTFRGQHKGYTAIKGVDSKSQTETYFKVVTEIQNDRWRGVPIILEGGKRLLPKKEIVITFKAIQNPHSNIKELENKIVFSLEPKEEITIEFWAKKPGHQNTLVRERLSYLFRDERRKLQYIKEYEKLLLDAILGNQLLFVSTPEVQNMWRFTDPIVMGWEKNLVPLQTYEPLKKKILDESLVVEQVGDPQMKKEIGVIGLGKMGGNAARRLVEKGWNVVGYNRTADDTKVFESEGGQGAYSVEELVSKLKSPRAILLSLPAGKATDDMIDQLIPLLSKGDLIIDGANAYYKESRRNGERVEKAGLQYLDAGISGGPGGARNGACIMIGGNRDVFLGVEPLFRDMARDGAVAFFEGYGAGHFVKMVHNGIEYGMMQALAEGFNILKNAPYTLDLEKVTEIYNNGSVIESRLVGWLEDAFQVFGQDLKGVSGTVGHTGEGAWTIETANDLKLKAKVIEDALEFRKQSEKDPSYTGKLLSGMRNQFGGHSIK